VLAEGRWRESVGDSNPLVFLHRKGERGEARRRVEKINQKKYEVSKTT
jgi:hypothetical protein